MCVRPRAASPPCPHRRDRPAHNGPPAPDAGGSYSTLLFLLAAGLICFAANALCQKLFSLAVNVEWVAQKLLGLAATTFEAMGQKLYTLDQRLLGPAGSVAEPIAPNQADASVAFTALEALHGLQSKGVHPGCAGGGGNQPGGQWDPCGKRFSSSRTSFMSRQRPLASASTSTASW